jgi:hypothetical protein
MARLAAVNFNLISGEYFIPSATIFEAVKPAAYILALLMLFLMAQPLVVECVAASAQKAEPVSCKRNQRCPMKPTCPREDNKECERSTGCNPFASCSQCHFVNASKFLYAPASGIAIDDNIIQPGEKVVAGFINDCWHPPESCL